MVQKAAISLYAVLCLSPLLPCERATENSIHSLTNSPRILYNSQSLLEGLLSFELSFELLTRLINFFDRKNEFCYKFSHARCRAREPTSPSSPPRFRVGILYLTLHIKLMLFGLELLGTSQILRYGPLTKGVNKSRTPIFPKESRQTLPRSST